MCDDTVFLFKLSLARQILGHFAGQSYQLLKHHTRIVILIFNVLFYQMDIFH
jgi:hypothetical protein